MLESNLEIGLSANETPQFQSLDHANAVSRLLAGDVDSVLVDIDGTMNVDAPVDGPILPGSFSPLHSGHAGSTSQPPTTGNMNEIEIKIIIVFTIGIYKIKKPL